MHQIIDLQQQLKEANPRSRLGPGSKQASVHPKSGTAAADEIVHLHTQVEGVESTIATLRFVCQLTLLAEYVQQALWTLAVKCCMCCYPEPLDQAPMRLKDIFSSAVLGLACKSTSVQILLSPSLT